MCFVRNGVIAAIGAYLMWGFFPIYFHWIKAAPAIEILAHRTVWSFILMATFMALGKRWGRVRLALQGTQVRWTVLGAAILLSMNWFIYIWAVNSGNVVASSLGYFINPLVNVLLGVIFLGERLRPGQWAPVGLASLGVIYLTITYGQIPWISLSLALTFGFYGLLKKIVKLSSTQSLTLETAAMSLPALAFLLYLGATGQGAFGHVSPVVTLLLILSGLVTALPLILFGYGAQRIPLYMLGLAQYIAPTIQFLLGVLVFDEPFTRYQLLGYVMIWVALALYSSDEVRNWRRKQSQLVMAGES